MDDGILRDCQLPIKDPAIDSHDSQLEVIGIEGFKQANSAFLTFDKLGEVIVVTTISSINRHFNIELNCSVLNFLHMLILHF